VIMDSVKAEIIDATGSNYRITAMLRTTDTANNAVTLPLIFTLRGSEAESGIVSIPGTDVRVRFEGVADSADAINISLLEKEPEFIVMKVMFFPWIFVLWAGTIIMFLGIAIAVYKRAVRAREV